MNCFHCTSFEKTDDHIVTVDYPDIINDRRTISVKMSVEMSISYSHITSRVSFMTAMLTGCHVTEMLP